MLRSNRPRAARTRALTALALTAPALGAVPTVGHAAGKVDTPYRDAVSYSADLTTDDDARAFTGTETITVRNAGNGSMARVWLRTWANGAVGCRRPAVVITSIQGGRSGRSERNCTAQEILLPAVLAPGASATITLTLSITAPRIQDRFGIAEGIRMFGNALPVVAQRDRSGWRLPGYSPYGESFVSSWARFGLTLHHPAAVKISAAGTTVTTPDPSGRTATTTSTIDARDTFWAASPDMAEVTGRTRRGTLVRAWSQTEAGADREDALDQAIGALEQLEKRLTAYPYDEYDVVVARIEAGGGMEYPGAVITDASTEVTRHETAHQWFYALVGNDQYREPWVDEGVTSFLEYSWTTPGELAAPSCYPARRLAVPSPQTFVTNSMSYWNRHVGQYSFAYDNPVCALREIRKAIGPAKFERTLKAVVQRHAQGFLTGAALRKAFNDVGGRKVERLWPKWGLGPGR